MLRDNPSPCPPPCEFDMEHSERVRVYLEEAAVMNLGSGVHEHSSPKTCVPGKDRGVGFLSGEDVVRPRSG